MTATDLATVEGAVAAQIRPLLHVHGGDIEVLSVSANGDVDLEFKGACRSCALKSVTYAIAVRQRLRQLPGVGAVRVAGVRLSDAALDRVAQAYAGYNLLSPPPQPTDAGAEASVTGPSRRG